MPFESSKSLESESIDSLDLRNISFDAIEELPEEDFDLPDEDNPKPKVPPKPLKISKKNQERPFGQFRNSYLGYMHLYSDAETVKNYLNSHRGWFRRCAHPHKTEPIGENGYALGIGSVGAFGYNLEPKIGLNLLPEDTGAYRIETIPVPEYSPQGYEVDFQAVMELMPKSSVKLALPVGIKDLTSVEWQLDLTVTLHFPKFIYAMPRQLIEKTGDAVLAHMVRQISRSLTAKVQDDFHSTVGVAISKKR